jgi:hypothetical protein
MALWKKIIVSSVVAIAPSGFAGIVLPLQIAKEIKAEAHISSAQIRVGCYKTMKERFGVRSGSGYQEKIIALKVEPDGTFSRPIPESNPWKASKFDQCSSHLEIEVEIKGAGTLKTSLVLDNLEDYRFKEGLNGYLAKLESSTIPERLSVNPLTLSPYLGSDSYDLKFDYQEPKAVVPDSKNH